jgi:hypothetical protein
MLSLTPKPFSKITNVDFKIISLISNGGLIYQKYNERAILNREAIGHGQ